MFLWYLSIYACWLQWGKAHAYMQVWFYIIYRYWFAERVTEIPTTLFPYDGVIGSAPAPFFKYPADDLCLQANTFQGSDLQISTSHPTNQSQILATFTSNICPLFTSNSFQVCGRNRCICKSESMIRLLYFWCQVHARCTMYICHFDIKLMSLSCHLTDVSFCQTEVRWLASDWEGMHDWHPVGWINGAWTWWFWNGIFSSIWVFPVPIFSFHLVFFWVFTVTVCHVHLSGCEPRRSYVNLAQMRVLFQYVDANGDGSLSLTEFIEPLCQHCLASHS